MSYIKHLSAKGLKSGDFSHELTKVNLITGKSFSGKTSRIEAIRLGLIGYVPELGKMPSATLALARNGTLSVEIEDSHGRKTQRHWIKGKSPGVSEGLPSTPPVLMDPSEYFSLSDAKKISYVFSMFAMEAHPDFTGTAIVASVENMDIGESTPEKVQIRREIVQFIDESDRARHDAGKPIQEWLAFEIAATKERLKLAKATAERMTKTVQGLTQISTATGPARNYSADITAKRDELAKLNESIGSLTASIEQYERLTNARAEAMRQLAGTPAAAVPDIASQVAKLTEEIASMEASNVEDESFSAKIEALEAQVKELQDDIDGHQSEVPALAKEHATTVSEIESLAREVARIGADNSRLHKELLEKLARPCCPECGTPTEGDVAAKLTAHYNDLIGENSRRCAETADKRNNLQGEAETLRKQIADAEKWDAGIEAKRREISAIQKQIGQLQTERQTASRVKAQQIEGKRKEIRALEASVKAAEQANKSRDELSHKIKLMDEELGKWEIEDLQLQHHCHKAYKLDCSQAIEALELQQLTFNRAKADQQRQAQVLLENAKAQADVEVTKAALAKLEEIQARMVETAFGEILKTVNAVTDGILDAPIIYRAGELGRVSGGTFIKHETFSGTEKALTYAGISLALAKDAPIKIVLIDELGKLDFELGTPAGVDSISIFLKRMVELTESGMCDQFIGCWSVSGKPAAIADYFKSVEGLNLLCL